MSLPFDHQKDSTNSLIVYVHQEEPGKSSALESETHGEDGNEDLLEVFFRFPSPSKRGLKITQVELSSSAPAADFDYDEVGDRDIILSHLC